MRLYSLFALHLVINLHAVYICLLNRIIVLFSSIVSIYFNI